MDGWVASWGCALQGPDGDDDPPLAGATVRQTVRVCLGGAQARLRLSNEYGRTPLRIAAAAVALPRGGAAGECAIQPGTSQPLSVGGAAEISIPPGGRVATDPFPLPAPPRTNLAVTMQLEPGEPVEGITTHPGSRTTSFVIPGEPRERTGRNDPVARAERTGRNEGWAQAVPVAHWYFLAALEVWPSEPASAVVFLGDSLTDGRGSTTDGNDRWPDQLLDRLPAQVGIVNMAAGGNRVLRDGLGIAALHRLDRDVLTTAGAAWLVVFEGVNDIGTAQAGHLAQRRVGDELLAGYEEIIERAHVAGIRVYGATITPFGGHDYDDEAGRRERTRRRVNAWIRGAGRFDAVLDFDAAVRDPTDERRIRAPLHVGDGLHLGPVGYRALAEAVSPQLFAHIT